MGRGNATFISHLPGHLLTDLLWLQFGHQAVNLGIKLALTPLSVLFFFNLLFLLCFLIPSPSHLFAHFLRLQVANLLRGVDRDIHSVVVANLRVRK